MKTIGNILWHFPFFGFVTAICTWLFGAILTATVIAAPIGLGLMEYGKLLFWRGAVQGELPHAGGHVASLRLPLFSVKRGLIVCAGCSPETPISFATITVAASQSGKWGDYG